MGRAVALERLTRGDTVIAIGSNAAKGRALVDQARSLRAADRLRFIQADLSTVAENERVIADIERTNTAVDALLLFANRPSPKRQETPDGLEYTFALYYVSRYLLSRGLSRALDAGRDPVIVSIAGVGNTAGAVHWDNLHLTGRYSAVRAQLQACRANDLLGVAFADRNIGKARFVMYHPGFTRSGEMSPLNPLVRMLITILAKLKAQPIETAIRPINAFLDHPPTEPLTAIDRGKPVDLSLVTLNKADANRLLTVTEKMLS
jgi:NAD(P)-dependent dehydrogenase (short-subunit alcohol dehydrogenase family)